MSNFPWYYYSLSFTCPHHFHWPWLYFNVTTVSNSFNRNFCVLIHLSWNFVQLFITSSRSWIFHYFWFSCFEWLKPCVRSRGLMTMTLFQGHKYILQVYTLFAVYENCIKVTDLSEIYISCKWCVLDSCSL